ncbi:hypothetical protein [Desulfoluna spongiiphila]|uniref:Uncharacterized protein n=1 Tax=Desulfoluna spongiiphila TaxID=419481 RepID=A0A1G5FJP5_9BACT|nr:hypothetical protein [Desulfoluna spongiiphila]SCY39080.1 hypothetical protein SAMN05216233_10891 [Desulfoluna spongiiphila]VVS95581.1 hypothetical protein DBB_51580 [Desulfoluna spongiiphila]
MASSSYPCDVSQGFNFQKDIQCLVGHLTALKIGDTEFSPDLAVSDPTKIGEDESTSKVVGVLSHIYWDGGYADPIQCSFQISTASKTEAAVLQHTKLSDTNVEFQFIVFDYDPDKKKFYQACHTNETAIKGLVEKSGGSLAINVDLSPSGEVVSPINYAMYLGIMPQEEEQDVHFAVSEDAKFVKKWGVSVAA